MAIIRTAQRSCRRRIVFRVILIRAAQRSWRRPIVFAGILLFYSFYYYYSRHVFSEMVGHRDMVEVALELSISRDFRNLLCF